MIIKKISFARTAPPPSPTVQNSMMCFITNTPLRNDFLQELINFLWQEVIKVRQTVFYGLYLSLEEFTAFEILL